jgi:hypothetical protein
LTFTLHGLCDLIYGQIVIIIVGVHMKTTIYITPLFSSENDEESGVYVFGGGVMRKLFLVVAVVSIIFVSVSISYSAEYWAKKYGGTDDEWVSSVQQTSDNGYIVAGNTESFGAGDQDIWLLKLDISGNIPECDIIGTSDILVTDTIVMGESISMKVYNASITIIDTLISPQVSPGAVTITCSDDGDFDEDGIPDEEDNCPDHYNPDQQDTDGDGVGDVCDNCPNDYNPFQMDCDEDGEGDICDADTIDLDGDGFACDNCPETPNASQENSDNDSHGDACDNCPNADNEDQADSDDDGIGDVCELPSAADIPTLSEWGLIIFMTIILGMGVVTLVRRRMV